MLWRRKKVKKKTETKKDSKIIPPKASSENLWILSFALVGGVLISKSFKIFISKKEKRKIILLDEPLVLNNCHKMFVKSTSIFWDYNNLDESYFYNYDVDGVNTKVTFKEGYYTFSSLKK